MFRRNAGARALGRTLTAASPLLGLACGAGSDQAEPIAVVGATLIDGTADGPLDDAVVVMRDGRFECVGDRTACAVPQDARVIDGTGHWISPGFIDTHVHLWWLQDSVWAAQSQALRLAAGITTVREMASSLQLTAVLRAAAVAGDARYPSPRIFTSGRVTAGAGRAGDPEDFGERTTELIDLGVDGLKVKGSVPPDGLARALEEAESRGYDVYGHAPDAGTTESELERAFRLGFGGVVHVLLLGPLLQASPDHSELTTREDRPAWIDEWQNIDPVLEDRLITAMLAEDVWLEPTLVGSYLQVNPHAYADARALHYLPDEMAATLSGDTLRTGDRAIAAESLRRMAELVGRFKARGGTLVVGTDQLEFPGFGLHEEMFLLVEAGLTPLEAMRAATSDAARVLGWQDRLGSVGAGKVADMVLLSADPLADIRNTREVRLVFKGGVEHDPTELEARLSGVSP